MIGRKAMRLVPAIALWLMLGCSAKEGEWEPAELLVSAAASLSDAMKTVETAYQSKQPDVKLWFNFGASGTLQQQIEHGAPADVLISAGREQMQALTDSGRIDVAHTATLLSNELVVIVSARAQTVPTDVNGLTDSAVKRIAVGEPDTVPAGAYARESLVHAKLWDPLKPKIVLSKDVRQVLRYVETGNADTGFVYRTDALTSNRIRVAFAVDPATYSTIEYPIGIVKSTKHPREAEAFFRYMQSAEAQAIFEKFGFSPGKR